VAVFTSTDIPSPISDRQTNVVQARSGDGREIRFSDPLPSINAQIEEAHTEKSRRREGKTDTITCVKLRHYKVEARGRAYSVPVLFKLALCDGTRLGLTESPFVDDSRVAGVVEKAGSYPRLT
jgi:hypothetical protein